MRLSIVLATAALLTGPAVLSVPAPALAQSSFGAQQPLRNQADWMKAADRALGNAIRGANSALATAGSVGTLSLDVALTITRDGRIADAQVRRSSGRPSIDEAVRRAFLRSDAVPPFTPDMRADAMTVSLALGTTTE